MTSRRGQHSRRTSTTIVIHRALHDADVVNRRGLRTTSPALCALDAAGERGIAVLDAALLRGFTTLEALASAHARYPKRHGGPRIGAYLAALGDGTRSEAERVAASLFRRAGITGWCANYSFGGYLIDFAFPERKLAIEIDGFALHRDAASFQHDRTRRNALVTAGWTVLNFTWSDLIDHPAATIARIRSALSMAA